MRRGLAFAMGLAACSVACGGSAVTGGGAGGGGGSSSEPTSTGSGGGGASTGGAGGATTYSNGGASSSGGAGGAATGGGGSGGLPDPNLDGPYAHGELDDQFTTPATQNVVPVHAVYPTSGPTPGPYPVIVVAHGFQLPASQYYGYARRLASFGYVALAPDYPTGLTSVNNVANAEDLLAAVDWAAASAALAGKVDGSTVGMTGHSMGGKLAVLAATMDARVKASITLDPVDSSMGCDPTDCPDVSSLTPTLTIPTGFLGETTDATAGMFGQACAPAADNYATFYAGAPSPSLQVTVNGADHMSFLDDVASCGFVCSFCKPATLANATVNALARAYVVAFYERWLRGLTGYDVYLTGAEAEARYVGTGEATIASK